MNDIEHVARLAVISDADAADLVGEKIDSVVCLNVLEHIEDDRRVLAELSRAIEPGGVLVVLVPAHPRLYSDLDRNLGHYRRYTRELLEARFREAGFVVERSRYFNWIGAIGWYVYGRLMKRPHITRAGKRIIVPQNAIIFTGDQKRNSHFGIVLKKSNLLVFIIKNPILVLPEAIPCIIGGRLKGLRNGIIPFAIENHGFKLSA